MTVSTDGTRTISGRDTPPATEICAGLAILTIGLVLTVVVPVVLRTVPGETSLTVRDGILFWSATIGVSGSLYLYWRRRRDARDRLRAAIFAELAVVGDEIYDEIRDMTVTELGTELYVPDESPIVVTVYENNAGEIGRLSEPEIEELTSFYTLASVLEPRMQRLIAKDEINEIEVVLLRRRLIELFNQKNDALEALRTELTEAAVDVERTGDIEEGDVVEEVANSLDIELDDTG